MTTDQPAAATVRTSIEVAASAARTFEIFTSDFDSWWPRSHHMGTAPMKKAIVEGRAGGRCYTEQTDGTECDWGTVLVWDPPRRLVFAWQIDGDWHYQPDLARSSEVEVRFTPVGSRTRVDLEHRHLERHGAGASAMRTAVESTSGWPGILQIFAARVERSTGEGGR